MNTITRNIPDHIHRSVKSAAAIEGRTLNETMISLLILKSTIGDPRQAALDNVEFRLVPHRSDDSQSSPDVYSWKLQKWVNGQIDSVIIL